MTEIYYHCEGKQGESFCTSSLSEAQTFVKHFGGYYEQKEKTTKSLSEPYCMKKHRTIAD